MNEPTPHQILKIPVNKAWFDLIKEGKVPYDMRAIKKYWTDRLFTASGAPKKYDFIEVINGYGSHRPTLVFKWEGFGVTPENSVTHLGQGKVFAIKLGEVIESRNLT